MGVRRAHKPLLSCGFCLALVAVCETTQRVSLMDP
jgi:hypothetical protein